MKKIIFILIVLSLISIFLLQNKTAVNNKAQPAISVVVSSYVPYSLVKELAGEKVSLNMILPPNAEPHEFEPSPGNIIAVDQSQLFVYISNELEPWARDLVTSSSAEEKAVALSEGISGVKDAHVWMDFNNWVLMADYLEREFEKIDSANKEYYQENLSKIKESIKNLQETYNQELSDCKTRTLVHVGHLAFGLLAEKYQLSLVSLDGNSHQAEPSVKKMMELVKQIRKENLPVIFSEEEISQRLVDTLASETKTEVLPLFTVEHISKKDFLANVSYEDLMYRNLANLKRGLQCQALLK